MFKIIDVSDENFYLFKGFFIDGFVPSKDYMIFGSLYDGNMPCGVISARQEGENIWCIESFYVLTKFRNFGVGSLLFCKLRNALLKSGCKKIYLKLIALESGINLLEKFFLKRGFNKAKIVTKIYRKSPKEIYGNKFIRYIFKEKSSKLPNDLKIIKFKDINSKIKDNALKKENVMYPKNLSPFANEHRLKDIGSLFMLDKVEYDLVAWLTALEAPFNCVLYRSFFVKKEYRGTKISKILLRIAIENHIKNLFNRDILFAISTDNLKLEKPYSKYFNLEKKDASYEIVIAESDIAKSR